MIRTVCVAALLLPGLVGCNIRTPAASPGGGEAAAAPAVRVETIPVAREDLRRVSEAVPAELLPYEKTDLYAKVSGFLKEIRVDYGDRVTKGEILAVIWVPELEKEFEQKKALAARAEADVALAREAVRAAEAECRRWKSQHERLTRVSRNGVLDQEALEESQYGFEVGKAKWDMARADVGVKEANLSVARADRDRVAALLEYTRVVAPYDGVVTRRHLHTGAFLHGKGGDQPLLTVVRTDVLRVIVDVPEKEVRYLDRGDRVAVDLDALPGRKFEWTITRLAPVLGPGKKVRVEVDVPNPEGNLYPGMYGHAAVDLEERRGALTLPTHCLNHDHKGTFVWLVADGKAKRQRVTVGFTDRERAEIPSGLSGAEEIICSGANALQEGQAVTAQPGPVARAGKN